MTGVSAGDKLTLWNADTAGALLNFLLADTDRRVTFVITRMEADDLYSMSLASRENTVYDKPILTLYLIPEPSSLLLLGGGLAAAALRRRGHRRR